MVNAVIFDMDGVIIDSERINQRATQKTYHDLGLPYTENDVESLKKLMGATRKYSWTLRKEKFNLPDTVEYYIALMESNRKEIVENEGLETMPGCRELIEDLFIHKLPMAVASSAPEHEIVDNLTRVGLMDYFDLLVSGMDCQRGKPDPEIFLRTAAKMGISPENCLVIEDSENGAAAAKAAGMRCIGYRNSGYIEMDLRCADRIVDDLHELNYKCIAG